MLAAQPNVVLICVDQWRGDCLGSAGHPIVSTPYLDQLSLGGVRFTRAYTATPSCIPARASLYTGLSPRTHGRVGYQDGVPWDYPVTVASEFTRHGYQTEAIGKLHVYPERSQIGFQHVVLHDGYLHFARSRPRNHALIDDYLPWLQQQVGIGADYFDHGLNCNSYVTRPWDKAEHLHPTNFIVTKAIEFLHRRDPRKPFFLYLGFHRPHPPLDPPAWAFEHYASLSLPLPPVGDWAHLFAPYYTPRNPALLAGELPPHQLQRARAAYYGLITHIDHQINRFWETLTEFGEANNTVLCFVSDHGDMLGDHHLFRKSLGYEGSAHVPFLLRGPRNSAIPAGATCDAVVELRDVMPTLLDCAGLPIPDHIEGMSLLPIIRGDVERVRPYLHGEHTVLGQSFQWITDGHWKYVWFSGSGGEQLFDLKIDPNELHDLAQDPQYRSEVEAWRACLIRELAGREEGFTDGVQLLPGQQVRPVLQHLREATRAR